MNSGERIVMHGRVISLDENRHVIDHGPAEDMIAPQPVPEQALPAVQPEMQEVQIHRVKLEFEGSGPSVAAMLGNFATSASAPQQQRQVEAPRLAPAPVPMDMPQEMTPTEQLTHPNQINLTGLHATYTESYVAPAPYVEPYSTDTYVIEDQQPSFIPQEEEREPRIKVKRPNYIKRVIATIGITSALLAVPAYNVAQHGKEDAEECKLNPVCVAENIWSHALVIPDIPEILDAMGDKK
jgi:hypothetical protein